MGKLRPAQCMMTICSAVPVSLFCSVWRLLVHLFLFGDYWFLVLSVTTGSSVKEVARSSVPVWRLSCGLIAYY